MDNSSFSYDEFNSDDATRFAQELNDMMPGSVVKAVTVVEYEEMVRRNVELVKQTTEHMERCKNKGLKHIYESIIGGAHEQEADKYPDHLICSLAAAFIQMVNDKNQIIALMETVADLHLENADLRSKDN